MRVTFVFILIGSLLVSVVKATGDSLDCYDKEDFESCMAKVEECITLCERGSGHGAGFCASFSSFMATIFDAFLGNNFPEYPIFQEMTNSIFWSAAYYCTSGAPYTACNYCGVGTQAGHILHMQNKTLNEANEMHRKALEGQRVVLDVTRSMSIALEDMRIDLLDDLSFHSLMQDFDNLNFKFDLISLNEDGSTKSDFSFQHFLASADIDTKDSIFGVYRRFKNLLIGQKKASHFYANRFSLFERDQEQFCNQFMIQSLFLMQFKIREMMFFVLRNDKSRFRAERYSRMQIKVAEDQILIDKHIENVCNFQPRLDFFQIEPLSAAA